MKMIRNIAVVATLASVFAFASCGTTETAKASAETAKEEVTTTVEAAVTETVEAVVEAAVEDVTTAVETTVDAAVDAVAQ